MPNYFCSKCKTAYNNLPSKPTCSNKPGCKDGLFVNEVKTQAQPTAQLSVPASYVLDTNRTVANNMNTSSPSTRNHRPSGAVYIHTSGNYAISADGSTHSGGQAAWKGFQLTSKGWTYLGSFDQALNHANRGGNSIVDNLPM